jgi:hypothetical protein
LRELREKEKQTMIIYMVVSSPTDTYDILSAWTTEELAEEALAKAIDEEESTYFKRFLTIDELEVIA